MKLTTRDKILITILAGVIFSWLFGCAEPQNCISEQKIERYVSTPSSSSGTTDAAYLQRVYAIYNDAYFQGRLMHSPEIDMDEEDITNMADTMCHGFTEDGGTNCRMHFSEKYTKAPRVADLTLLHEMCHVKVWMRDMDTLGKQVDHGNNWRACMVQLDTEGAFRQILIDNYSEGAH